MNARKIASALGLSVTLAFGVAGQARADAMANALIDITHFTLNGPGGVPLSMADFTQLSFLDTLTNTAVLVPGGVAPPAVAIAAQLVPVLDAPMACVPAACAGIGQNVFTPSLVPPAATFARGDSLLENAPIFNPFGIPVGVHAATIAETSLNSNAFGSSGSNIILTSGFTFVLTHNMGDVGMSFDATTFLRAWTAAGTGPGTSAGAGMKWEVTLEDADGNVLLDWAPNGIVGNGTETGLVVTAEDCTLNKNATATFNQPSAPTENHTGCHFAATTNFTLVGGQRYSFTIHHAVNTQAQEAPEPSPLALIGIALAGLGFIRRRWS